jgi:hypothetical protein
MALGLVVLQPFRAELLLIFVLLFGAVLLLFGALFILFGTVVLLFL